MKFKFHFLFLFFFLLNSNNIISQDNSIRLYYECIVKAEALIFLNKIDSALIYYSRANSGKNLFHKDAYNAALAAIKTSNYNLAYKFTKNLMQKGVSHHFFEQDSNFVDMVKSNIWNPDSLFHIKPTYNKDLRNLLLDLLEKDQEYRKFNLNEEKRLKVDYEIEKTMDSLFNVYGYLSEELIGVFPNSEYDFSNVGSPLDILLTHQIRLMPAKYKSFFEKSVYNGKMENKVLVMHSTNFDNDSSFLFKCFYFGICNILKIGEDYITCGKALEELVNKNRFRILMPPLSHEINSIKFNLSVTNFKIGSKPASFDDSIKRESEKRKREFLNNGYMLIYLNSNGIHTFKW